MLLVFPFVCGDLSQSMWSILEWVIDFIELSILYFDYFPLNLLHSINESIKLSPEYITLIYLSSDSVGSIINVPATGKDIVGAWNP